MNGITASNWNANVAGQNAFKMTVANITGTSPKLVVLTSVIAIQTKMEFFGPVLDRHEPRRIGVTRNHTNNLSYDTVNDFYNSSTENSVWEMESGDNLQELSTNKREKDRFSVQSGVNVGYSVGVMAYSSAAVASTAADTAFHHALSALSNSVSSGGFVKMLVTSAAKLGDTTLANIQLGAFRAPSSFQTDNISPTLAPTPGPTKPLLLVPPPSNTVPIISNISVVSIGSTNISLQILFSGVYPGGSIACVAVPTSASQSIETVTNSYQLVRSAQVSQLFSISKQPISPVVVASTTGTSARDPARVPMSINLLVTGLLSAVQYSVMCIGSDFSDELAPFNNAIKTKILVKTSCCRVGAQYL